MASDKDKGTIQKLKDFFSGMGRGAAKGSAKKALGRYKSAKQRAAHRKIMKGAGY